METSGIILCNDCQEVEQVVLVCPKHELATLKNKSYGDFFSDYLAVRKVYVIFAAVKRKSVINSKMIRGTMNNRQGATNNKQGTMNNRQGATNNRQGIMSNRQGAMPRQKGENFSVIFVPDYLGVPNNLLTHTHTHTHTHTFAPSV